MATFDLDSMPIPPTAGSTDLVDVHPAACVIVLRGDPFEILLIRRHQRSSFLPGAWVFPGGRMDEEDSRNDELATIKACAVRELREETGLLVDEERLVCTARWITPPGVHKRFDTWFFLARVPDGSTAVADQTEGTEALWITPRDALDKQARSELLIILPTIKNLEAIASYSCVDDLLEARRNAEIRTVQPVIITEGGKRTVVIPD